MDYSTISNKTNVTEAEEELSANELSEKYYSLRKQYDNLCQNYENIKQELHDTRRCYQTALDVQSHLSSELEAYQADENKRKNDLNSRITTLQEDILVLRKEKSDIIERHAAEIKNLEVENRRIREEQVVAPRQSPERDNTAAELEEARKALSAVNSELEVTKEAVLAAKDELTSWRLKVEELVTEVGELRAAAEIRKEEMNAIAEREASALADLTEMRAILHQVDAPEQQPHAAKGNSIFAEVEDKRQEMAKNLIQMKQTNSRLRRDLANKQAELDTLLHEKQTIWEQQAGATAHYDRELIENYEERITQLEGACEKQRRELSRWFSKLQEPSPGWLPAVLEHLMSECQQLRAEVLSRGAAQLASAVQVRELRRKLVQAVSTTKQSPTHTTPDMDKVIVPKYVPIKKDIDDVRKKVSFN